MAERDRDPLELWVGTWTPKGLDKSDTQKTEQRQETKASAREGSAPPPE